jgi:hypothetical protein
MVVLKGEMIGMTEKEERMLGESIDGRESKNITNPPQPVDFRRLSVRYFCSAKEEEQGECVRFKPSMHLDLQFSGDERR